MPKEKFIEFPIGMEVLFLHQKPQYVLKCANIQSTKRIEIKCSPRAEGKMVQMV